MEKTTWNSSAISTLRKIRNVHGTTARDSLDADEDRSGIPVFPWGDTAAIRFPKAISRRDGHRTYSILMRQFGALAEIATSSDAHLPCAFLLSRFATHMQRYLRVENGGKIAPANRLTDSINKSANDSIREFRRHTKSE